MLETLFERRPQTAGEFLATAIGQRIVLSRPVRQSAQGRASHPGRPAAVEGIDGPPIGIALAAVPVGRPAGRRCGKGRLGRSELSHVRPPPFS